MHPEFPKFKPVELEDRGLIKEILWKYQPQTAEWTFTNLFIWRSYYAFQWSTYRDWLIVLCKAKANDFCALQPIGPPSRLEVVRMLLRWLQKEKGGKEPYIERADQCLISEIEGAKDLVVKPIRDHFDYVYRRKDLVELTGRKYHSKKNHINKFLRFYSFTSSSLNESHRGACRELVDRWCQLRRCGEDMDLLGEWEAVGQALIHFPALKLQGEVILIGNEVKAFALGELLNKKTVVVHIEKADPEIPELYTVVNQQFCAKNRADILYVNREQDLGVPGLRKAKLSYYPDHLAEKFQVSLAGT